MPDTPGTAVAPRKDTPAALITRYADDFRTVLPSHIKPDTWLRVASGALRRGKVARRDERGRDVYELEVAAANNPAKFLAALLDAARQGLEPGTEEYYLTVRKENGQPQILGITGYQGYIELMYRAGAVSTVVAEIVRENDTYRYRRGIDATPVHEFPAFASDKVRGAMVGVYAYAVMRDGAISRVIELGGDDIDRIKRSSQGADSKYSPWQTNPESMWLKSAIRQLQKWVPTSPEYLDRQARAAGIVIGAADGERTRVPTEPLAVESELGVTPQTEEEEYLPPPPDGVDGVTGEVYDADVVDDTPTAANPAAAPDVDAPTGPKATREQIGRMAHLFVDLGINDPDAKGAEVSAIVGRVVAVATDLTRDEAAMVVDVLTSRTADVR